MKKKFKIFDYTWHVPHQYDMMYALRNDCEFYYCINVKSEWDITKRPKPDNLNLVTHYEPGKYDIAILHLDQSVVLHNQKREIYVELNKFIKDIPKVVINHGTPVFPEGFYGSDLCLRQMEQHCVTTIKELLGGNTMVVNSHTAASNKEWGFGIPIVHGINVKDWLDLPKEPRVFSALSPLGFDTYYNRDCLVAVSEFLKEIYGHYLAYAKVNIDTGNSPEDYKNYLGRSLLYLDTSYRTPMNRARTEAFLSGCCVIQVEGAHDLERWARHKENIVLVPDNPEEIAKVVAYYIEDGYQEAIKIGQKGKKMALEHFHPERYRLDWLQVIQRLVRKDTIYFDSPVFID